MNLYELKINEDDDAIVDFIALVENPAIESNFLAFSKDKKHFTFTVDEEKKVLLGAAMIPNMRIFRQDDAKGDYEVFFSKETIEKIAQVFSKRGFHSNFNIEHNSNQSADSFIFQSMIVNEKMGIKPMNLPDGSWVIGVKVESENVWNDVKAGKFKGFSVEGMFQLLKQGFTAKEKTEEQEVYELLQEIKKNFHPIFKSKYP